MKTSVKHIWKILRTKKSERTIREQAELNDFFYNWIGLPIRIIIFPVMLIVKLYKWTYEN